MSAPWTEEPDGSHTNGRASVSFDPARRAWDIRLLGMLIASAPELGEAKGYAEGFDVANAAGAREAVETFKRGMKVADVDADPGRSAVVVPAATSGAAWQVRARPRSRVMTYEIRTAFYDPSTDVVVAQCWDRATAEEIVRLHNEALLRAGGAKPETIARRNGLFVHGKSGTTCPDCTPDTVDLGDPAVETWELGSAGWIAAPICDTCRIAIPVHVDSAT